VQKENYDKSEKTKVHFLGKEWEIVKKITAEKALKPDILIVERQEQFLVAKDFRSKAWMARYLWGPLNIMYEKFLLNKLAGVAKIPQVIGLEDYNCLLISRIEGDEIKKCSHLLVPDFFDQLLKIADDLHDRGVLHLDLGHKSNIMVDQDGNPAIIDFNASLYLPQNSLFRPLINLLGKVDRYSILRLKIKFRPQDASPAEKRGVEKFLRLRKLWVFDRLLRKMTNYAKNAGSHN
jgi:serine/threonine protein kinase